MEAKEDQPKNIDEYIAQFPPDVQVLLTEVREVVRQAAPEATERMGYGMPCFYLNGNLVYFAAAKAHIGFYPTASGIEAFKDELGPYKWSRGAVQFPLDQPMPHELITRVTQFRRAENLKKSGTKKQGRAAGNAETEQ